MHYPEPESTRIAASCRLRGGGGDLPAAFWSWVGEDILAVFWSWVGGDILAVFLSWVGGDILAVCWSCVGERTHCCCFPVLKVGEKTFSPSLFLPESENWWKLSGGIFSAENFRACSSLPPMFKVLIKSAFYSQPPMLTGHGSWLHTSAQCSCFPSPPSQAKLHSKQPCILS